MKKRFKVVEHGYGGFNDAGYEIVVDLSAVYLAEQFARDVVRVTGGLGPVNSFVVYVTGTLKDFLP